MKARPILFSAPMIQALESGSKSQTRRVMKPQPFKVDAGTPYSAPAPDATGCTFTPIWCPYGEKGDLLIVKEAWRTEPKHDAARPSELPGRPPILPLAGTGVTFPSPLWGRYRHARFMPRWASRLTLEITEVRVERLQSISEEDAVAEGMASDGDEAAIISYSRLWEEINGKGSWDMDPFVWAISFKVHRCNVDAFLKERGA